MSADQLCQHLSPFAEPDISGGVGDERIAAASAAIHLSFPPQYVEFLRAIGTLGVSSEEIIGLGGPGHLDLVRITNRLRNRPANAKFPDSLIPLSHDGLGNYDSIDTSSPTSQGEFAIVQWAHDGGDQQQLKVLAGSFDEWFVGFLNDVRKLDGEEED